tara:strand:- start:13833 stop:14726 length:894 start_codon:yes stop_codon:yes gene_type:complete
MFEKLYKLEKQLKSKFLFDHDMSKLTWFRTGGNTKLLIIVENSIELEIILQTIKSLPRYVIGAGSNLLVRDGGYNGILLKLGKGFNKISLFENYILVSASILDIHFSNFARKNNISGFEFFSGIPGTLGGAIKMNAGCFGSETSDLLKEIEYFDKNGDKKNAKVTNLKLDYRYSDIEDSSIITNAKFFSNIGNLEEINNKHDIIKKKRLANQPILEKTSGSTFKNPPNQFAAKLIEESGCKGLSVGDAHVSNLHANFIINSNKAKASDIEKLGKIIIEKVQKKFNIILEWEIKIIGA